MGKAILRWGTMLRDQYNFITVIFTGINLLDITFIGNNSVLMFFFLLLGQPCNGTIQCDVILINFVIIGIISNAFTCISSISISVVVIMIFIPVYCPRLAICSAIWCGGVRCNPTRCDILSYISFCLIGYCLFFLNGCYELTWLAIRYYTFFQCWFFSSVYMS